MPVASPALAGSGGGKRAGRAAPVSTGFQDAALLASRAGQRPQADHVVRVVRQDDPLPAPGLDDGPRLEPRHVPPAARGFISPSVAAGSRRVQTVSPDPP